MLHTGSRRLKVPVRYGKWKCVYDRFCRWSRGLTSNLAGIVSGPVRRRNSGPRPVPPWARRRPGAGGQPGVERAARRIRVLPCSREAPSDTTETPGMVTTRNCPPAGRDAAAVPIETTACASPREARRCEHRHRPGLGRARRGGSAGSAPRVVRGPANGDDLARPVRPRAGLPLHLGCSGDRPPGGRTALLQR